MRFAFVATIVALVGIAAAAPSGEVKRLSCYDKCMQGCYPPGAGQCSIICGQQCK
ncbi:Ctr domain-containing protein [Ceratobasidium sp. AG-Ba]|nr:Ctr domain-containing protein [Ceratobasidium sp. AG-Ba]